MVEYKMNKKEAEELEDDKQMLSNAILELFATYNSNYGSIKKFKRKNNLIIEARTGGWSENEEAITKFNAIKFGGVATIEWWFLDEWRRGGYYRWKIPLFLVKDFNIEKG